MVRQKGVLEHAKKRGQKDGEHTEKTQRDSISKEFKVALAALTTAEDLEALEEQFFQVKAKAERYRTTLETIK